MSSQITSEEKTLTDSETNRSGTLYLPGWSFMGAFLSTVVGALIRSFFPRIICEPHTRHKAGYPFRYTLGIICFFTVMLLASFSCISNLVAQEEIKTLTEEQAKEAQKKLEKALKSLKREIRTEVKVEDGGAINGVVKCINVKNSENVVVYIEEVGGNKYAAPLEHGVVDQLNLTYVPHVIAVQKGTTIDFPNSDIVRHNVFSPPECCQQFNLGTYDEGVVKTATFDESCEVPLLCNVHEGMLAFVLVLDNPYFSVTGSDGAFKIENVPPGTYKLTAWHEKLMNITKDVTVKSGKTVSVGFFLKKGLRSGR